MMNEFKEIVRKATAVYGPSGRETKAGQLLTDMIRPYVDEIRFDALGNAVGIKKGTSGKKVMLSAHMDQIGLIVLDIDENGGKYLVLPVDEAALCAHLLVPPESTVSFTSEPFEFMDAKSKEAFLLVATEEPVDFSILMSPIRGNGGKPLKSGLYRNIYETK